MIRGEPWALVARLLEKPFTLWAAYVLALVTVAATAKTLWPGLTAAAALPTTDASLLNDDLTAAAIGCRPMCRVSGAGGG